MLLGGGEVVVVGFGLAWEVGCEQTRPILCMFESDAKCRQFTGEKGSQRSGDIKCEKNLVKVCISSQHCFGFPGLSAVFPL